MKALKSFMCQVFSDLNCTILHEKPLHQLGDMFHSLFHNTAAFVVVSFFTYSLRPVTTISISTDTLKTIRNDEVYKVGYDKAAHQRFQYYRATSPVGLIRLAKLDQKIFEAIQNLTRSNSPSSPKLNKSVKEYMEDYSTTSAVLIGQHNATDDQVKAQVVAGNLIGAYRMVRRIRKYVQSWLVLSLRNDSLLSQPELDFLATINSLKSNGQKKGPHRTDFQFTMIAIILTQFKFEWKPADIAKGLINGMELGVTLQAAHCVELGVHAIASLMYPVSIEWLQLAVSKIQNGDHSVQLSFALSLLEKARAEHDRNWQPLNGIHIEKTFYERRLNETTDEKTLKWQRKNAPDPQKTSQENDLERLWDVCSGKIHQTDLEKSKLFCWYETKVHPTWTIGPLKVELHSTTSFEILQFHNVMGGSLIEGLQETCENKLFPTVSAKNDTDLYPKYSLSETCYPPPDCPHQMHTLQLSERITGLSTSKLRAWHTHTTLHPPGGHLWGHLDQVNFEDQIAIATLGFCLDEPTMGGETGFSFAKVAFKCIKGSAIFWYNTFKSSEVHYDSVHSGCPVIQGQKSISAHLIRYHHQTRALCDRDKEARLEYLVNGQSKHRQQE